MALTADMVDVLPRSTGVYLMRDSRGKVIYVGKAIDIRNRVRAYLGQDTRPSVSAIREHTNKVDFVLTHNETEALLLENQLIKSHRPRYNVVLKDDKSYISIKVGTNHMWPSISLTRRVLKDGARYFGPYSSARATRNTLSAIGRIFPLRRCKESEFTNRTRPCLYHQINVCSAPCVNRISLENYLQIVRDIILFLEGKNKELTATLETRMHLYSEKLEFERAAKIRDQINAIQATLVPQTVSRQAITDVDVFGSYRHKNHAEIAVLRFEKGTLMDSNSFDITIEDEPDFITPCLLQFYLGRKDIPSTIFTDVLPQETTLLTKLLSEMRGGKICIRQAQRGSPKHWVSMAQETALNNVRENISALDEIARIFKLHAIPWHIECYDISNLQGENSVGSRSVFIGAEPRRDLYRRYKIKEVQGQNDFAMLNEILSRRFRNESDPQPDLIILDGGKGQLAIGEKVLHELGIRGIKIIGMAKERGIAKDRFFLPGRKDALFFPRGSQGLRMLQYIRDEAHRFAVEYHRTLRSKDYSTKLTSIPGIGPKKAAYILKNIPDIYLAKRNDLGKIPRLTQEDIEKILMFICTYQDTHT